MVRSNLGLLLRSSGRLEEAQAQLAQAASQRSQELGPDHPSTLTSYHALLLTMMDRGVDIQVGMVYICRCTFVCYGGRYRRGCM